MNSCIIECGDNLPKLNALLDSGRKVDLIITDPPYNVGKDFGNNTDNQDDAVFLGGIYDRLSVASDLLTPNGSLICFASHLYVAKIQILLEKKLHYRRMMIWHYRNGMSRQNKEPVTEYEPFLWMSKSSNEWTYNTDDVRVPYKSERVKSPVYKKAKNGANKAWLPNPNGAKRGDIWEYPCLAGKLYASERTEHPTQKPLSLITDLLKAFVPKVDGRYSGTVLDPYLGSGTTAVACDSLNREGHDIQFIGMELEENWVNITEERLNALDKKYANDIL